MKSLLILCLLPCMACADCQEAYEAAYTSPELYDYADYETIESCSLDAGCAAHAVLAGIPESCVVNDREERQYLASQFCEREFHDINPVQILELEQCSTDAECQDMALKLGVSRECVE